MAARARDRDEKREEEGPLRGFIEEIRDPEPPISRSPSTGIFLNANPETTPLALRANVEHNCILHENVVIMSMETLNVPTSTTPSASPSTTSATATTGSRT